jgi:hypothetical protein
MMSIRDQEYGASSDLQQLTHCGRRGSWTPAFRGGDEESALQSSV